MGYSPWGHKKSDTTEQLTYLFFFSDSFPLWVITRCWVELPVLYHRSLLVIYFIYSNVCTLVTNL